MMTMVRVPLGCMMLVALVVGLSTPRIALAGLSGMERNNALTFGTREIDFADGALVWFTVYLVNEAEKDYQPVVERLNFWTWDGNQRKHLAVFVTDPVINYDHPGNDYLIGVQLKPGRYMLRDIVASARTRDGRAEMRMPVFAEFAIPRHEVVYLGRMVAVNWNRHYDHQTDAADPTSNIAAQKRAGFLKGGLNAHVYDNFPLDYPWLLEQFAFLKDYDIHKMRLFPGTDDEIRVQAKEEPPGWDEQKRAIEWYGVQLKRIEDLIGYPHVSRAELWRSLSIITDEVVNEHDVYAYFENRIASLRQWLADDDKYRAAKEWRLEQRLEAAEQGR